MTYQRTGKRPGPPISDKVKRAAEMLAANAGVRETMRALNVDWRQIVRAKAINEQPKETPQWSP
jgi:hypothetical protein